MVVISVLHSTCEILENLNIPYMLSGSLAMSVYSVARSTRAIDLVVELLEADVDRLLAAFPNHYSHRPSIIEEIKRGGMFNLIDQQTGYKLDFILRKRTKYASLAFSRKQQREVSGRMTWIISIEDLILAKLSWIQELQSSQQMNDIKSLVDNPNIDWKYIYQWIENLGLTTFQLLPKP